MTSLEKVHRVFPLECKLNRAGNFVLFHAESSMTRKVPGTKETNTQ